MQQVAERTSVVEEGSQDEARASWMFHSTYNSWVALSMARRPGEEPWGVERPADEPLDSEEVAAKLLGYDVTAEGALDYVADRSVADPEVEMDVSMKAELLACLEVFLARHHPCGMADEALEHS